MRVRESSRREAGFTLIEVAIATLLLMLGLMLAAQLLVESGQLMARAHVRTLEQQPRLALELLRRDVRSARPPLADPGDGVLRLRHDDEIVIWRLRDDCLERGVAAPASPGSPVAARCLLTGVVRWQWQASTPYRLDVQVIRKSTETGSGFQLLDDLRRRPVESTLEPLTLSVALRASGARRGRW